jgi:hypothetical protein
LGLSANASPGIPLEEWLAIFQAGVCLGQKSSFNWLLCLPGDAIQYYLQGFNAKNSNADQAFNDSLQQGWAALVLVMEEMEELN